MKMKTVIRKPIKIKLILLNFSILMFWKKIKGIIIFEKGYK